MAPLLAFATNNIFIGGICTGMAASWAKTCLIKQRPLTGVSEMGYGHSIAAELGQLTYENKLGDDYAAFLQSKGLNIDLEKHRKAQWNTTKKGRFRDAAQDVLRDPGVYLLCTPKHSMAACYFPSASGVKLAFFDPNDGQYNFSDINEFPGWYGTHVVGGYKDVSDAELYKLSR